MKFNRSTLGKNRTKNHEGAEAYRLSDKWELYALVMCTTLQHKFYEKDQAQWERLKALIVKVGQKEPQFVAKLAVYAREQMYLRTVPLVLTGELARIHNGDSLVRKTLNRVILRPDEIMELLAYYQATNIRTGTKRLGKLSKQVQKGIADAFNRFDEYQFAKYNRATEVKLKDALFLTHPKAKDEAQQKIFDKIAADTLTTPDTWEVKLSQAGQQPFGREQEKTEAMREKWEDMIFSGKMGYMAMLRNLRNFLDYQVSAKAIQVVAERLADPRAVRKAKQLPFRYFSAYRELEGHNSVFAPQLLEALEAAMEVTADNIRGYDRNTRLLIATDMSGSMDSRLSDKSKIMLKEVGLVLSCLLKRKCETVISGLFGQTYKVMQLRQRGILDNVQRLKRVDVGYATNGYLAIKDLIWRRAKVDKVMIFTDCQLWNSNDWSDATIEKYWNQYKRIAPNAKLYLFDLAGYGTTPLNILRADVFLVAGWSDKIFDILAAIEEGSDALTVIDAIELN